MFLEKKSKGFVLVELLVVIAIIGILSTIITVSLKDAAGRARDVKRIAEINVVGRALGSYYTDKGKYPVQEIEICIEESESFASETQAYLPQVPKDPLYEPEGKYCYSYRTINDGQDYKLHAESEKDEEPPSVFSPGGGGIGRGR